MLRERSRIMLETEHEERFSRATMIRGTRETRWFTKKYVIEDPMDGVVGQDFRRSNSSAGLFSGGDDNRCREKKRI